jgi:lipopolysaccharide export system protein LptC
MTDTLMALSASWHTAPAERDARRKAFTAARRHSRRVRVLRVLLPLLTAGGVAGFVALARLAMPAGLDLESAGLSVTRSSIIMDRPHLTGFDRHGREYSVAAKRAIQPLLKPGQVRLEEIEAKVGSKDGKDTTITAEAGDYDHAKRTLKLLGAVVVDSSEGYILRMTDAAVDFSAGSLVSENPVTIGYGNSTIDCDHLSVSDDGKTIVIDGHVRTVLMPPKQPADATPQTE